MFNHSTINLNIILIVFLYCNNYFLKKYFLLKNIFIFYFLNLFLTLAY
jgi:hypothetical protein